MRKMLRNMAKAKMARNGVTKINKRMSHGRWRRYINAYPVNAVTGAGMPRDFLGKKRGKGHRDDCLYRYC